MKLFYNIHEAKTQFSRLVEEAAVGEEVIIAKSGKPVARLVAYSPQSGRQPGRFKKDIHLEEGVFDPLDEDELRCWEGGQS